MSIPEVFGKIAELAGALGVKGINTLPGCWEHKVDEHWTVAVNGQRKPVECHPEGAMGAEIPPFTAAVWWHGWLAGLVNAAGGSIAAHPDGANEERLLRDLETAIQGARTR